MILAGSDRRRSELPEGTEQHPLAAYKGAALTVEGRPLVTHLVERSRASGCFEPVVIAGPSRIYAPLETGAAMIDTDADIATNLRAALSTAGAGTLALMACDVLPGPQELRDVLAEYHRGPPSAIWFPLVRVPREPDSLGAFAWKPTYSVRPERGSEPVRVLPGHLGIVTPSSMRLELLYRLLGTAYRTRNRQLGTKRSAMLRATLFDLLGQDLRHVLALRVPNLTWTVLSNGLGLVRDLRANRLTVEQLERRIGRIFLTARHRRTLPAHGVTLPLIDVLSLAEDIDTAEEARAVGAKLDLAAEAGSGQEVRR